MGSASLGLAYVACGRLSLYFHKHLYPWDIASGLLLIREAGGTVMNGNKDKAEIEDKEIIAANKKLVKQFLSWLERS
jgi:myo-inositol-1(or 4)-monophosphatase